MIRTNRIADLLKRDPESTDADLFYLAKHVPSVAASCTGRRRDGFSAPPGVSMRWLRKHERAFGRFEERRVWVCGFLEFFGEPCALVQCSGREGDDEGSMHVFDGAVYVEAIRRITGRSAVRVPGIVRVGWNLSDAGIQYGACVDCHWDRIWLDQMIDDPCVACGATTATHLARRNMRSVDEYDGIERLRVGRRRSVDR